MTEGHLLGPEAGATPELTDLTISSGTDVETALAVASDVAAVLGETAKFAPVCGALLAASAGGSAVLAASMAKEFPLQGAAGVSWLGLFALVLLAWLRAAVLFVLAERPVADGLAELRRVAGAPADPTVPWVPFSIRPAELAGVSRANVQILIGAAALRHSRARLALAWAVTAAGGLFALAACVEIFIAH